jgi:hypothetical protein
MKSDHFMTSETVGEFACDAAVVERPVYEPS